jgi:hypothetical protein
MKVAPGSSETSVLTRATRRNNSEDTILHSHRRENLKSYNFNHTWRRVQITQLNVMQFSPPSHQFIPVLSIYSSQHPQTPPVSLPPFMSETKLNM